MADEEKVSAVPGATVPVFVRESVGFAGWCLAKRVFCFMYVLTRDAKITARNDFGEAALVTADATSWSVQELCEVPYTNATMPVMGTGRAVTLSPGRGNETVIGTCSQMSPEGELDCSEDLICFDAWVCYSEEVCPNGE